MITANRTADGRVVYLAEDGTWSRLLAEGAVFGDASDLDRALAAAGRDAARVCGAYAIGVRVDGARITVTVSLREQIRAHGPSVGRQERRVVPTA
ncbi:MAG: DUF2849 domain-containing protein [Nannocystaceae bacterium]